MFVSDCVCLSRCMPALSHSEPCVCVTVCVCAGIGCVLS